jgi:regulator of sigma E protease
MLVYVVLKKLCTQDVNAKSIAGPLGIFQIMYVSAFQGWGRFLWLVQLLTVNIGLLNLLPIPPLDGGRLVMVGYEKLRGRRMSQKLQEVILIAGVAVVLMIFVFATFNDVRRMFF